MHDLDDLKKASLAAPDVIVAVAAEPRGSTRCVAALRRAQLYVVGLKSGGDEAAYQRLVHRDGPDVVWPLFSSWATASTFIDSCGVEDQEQFIIVPADEFLVRYDPAITRAFLNPKTPYERELWPEEARAVQEELQLRASRLTLIRPPSVK